jgi:hypothetical protein
LLAWLNQSIFPSESRFANPEFAERVRSADPDLARDRTLFALPMGIRESSISQVYVQGRRVTTG